MEQLVYYQRINMALSRAAAMIGLRKVDETKPSSWEFSAFSQNGEDGIIDYLTSKILTSNRYFVEIGASDGLENNTSWLAFGRKHEGIMIEGSEDSVRRIKKYIEPLALGVEARRLFVNLDNVDEVISSSQYIDPDFFSLDIDGIDYYIMEALLKKGFRPKIVAVEYNSAFGPDQCITIEYDHNFIIDFSSYENYLYFGASVSAWKKLFALHGYKFVTVDSRGVNAFFVDPKYFDGDFSQNLRGSHFEENFYQTLKYKTGWKKQFELIEGLQYKFI